MNETWQAALAERGEKAFELFDVYCGGMFVTNFCNSCVENYTSIDDAVRLKPVAELVKLDIEQYGNENAHFLYEYKNVHFDDWQKPESILSMLTTANCEIRRKPYANAPFNLEWAKAGVDVEFLNPCSSHWDPVVKKGDMDEEAMQVFFEQRPTGLWIEPIDLRHPFPPVKDLGL